MKVVGYILLAALMVMCKPLHIKEFELETIPSLRGKVEKMVITDVGYDSDSLNTGNTEILRTVSTILLNKNNKTLKQMDLYLYSKSRERPIVADFHYQDKLLTSIESNVYGRRDRKEYKYDKRRNLIETRDFENDTLVFILSVKYDMKNNPVEVKRHRISSGKTSTEEYKYDYKEGTVTIQTVPVEHSSDSREYYDENYLRNHYDKKGRITKTEIITQNKVIYHTTIYQYNAQGDVVKSFSLDENGYTIGILKSYEYTYDTQGNVIVKKIFENGGLVGKTTYDINYR